MVSDVERFKIIDFVYHVLPLCYGNSSRCIIYIFIYLDK
nr:MAG TPA: hypothetical protein [Caudoviricetes sp.]